MGEYILSVEREQLVPRIEAMKHRVGILAVGVAIAVLLVHGKAVEGTKSGELNTALMQSTFKIEGQRGTIGTGFLLGIPAENEPGRSHGVFVTAAHVLEDIQGEFAILHIRHKQASTGWKRSPLLLKIRDGERPRWVRHPEADVAVMYLNIPDDSQVLLEGLVPVAFLADDNTLTKYHMHPGVDLNCLGYPMGLEGNPVGFPILRSGKIASYPLLPTKETKVFLFDFEVFRGNSGGPVYFVQPEYRGGVSFGPGAEFIVGLVSELKYWESRFQDLIGEQEERYSLGLGVVVHASLIRETINLLPPPTSAESENYTAGTREMPGDQ